MPKYYIYTLELEDRKIYVGATSNLTRRYRQHSSGQGANYTRKHKPLRISSYCEVEAVNFEEACIYEDARALEVIFRVGIGRARGGRFFSPKSKQGKLRTSYNAIDDKYKNIKQIKAKGNQKSLVGMNPPKSKKKKHHNVWAKQVAMAKKQLSIAHQRFN